MYSTVPLHGIILIIVPEEARYFLILHTIELIISSEINSLMPNISPLTSKFSCIYIDTVNWQSTVDHIKPYALL
jgi:hypothetical protein